MSEHENPEDPEEEKKEPPLADATAEADAVPPPETNGTAKVDDEGAPEVEAKDEEPAAKDDNEDKKESKEEQKEPKPGEILVAKGNPLRTKRGLIGILAGGLP